VDWYRNAWGEGWRIHTKMKELGFDGEGLRCGLQQPLVSVLGVFSHTLTVSLPRKVVLFYFFFLFSFSRHAFLSRAWMGSSLSYEGKATVTNSESERRS